MALNAISDQSAGLILEYANVLQLKSAGQHWLTLWFPRRDALKWRIKLISKLQLRAAAAAADVD